MLFSSQSTNNPTPPQAPWHAALVRWGDIVFGLAALTTNQRAAAETLVVEATSQVFAAKGIPDPEEALYAALARSAPRRQPLRQHILPRSLGRLAPTDRILLGLWLLRDIDGARLATICGLPPQDVVVRLTTIIGQYAAPTTPREDPAACITLATWLGHDLGLAAMPAEHLRICPNCQAAVASWQDAKERLYTLLRDFVGPYRLPQTCIERIERRLEERQQGASTQWWQQQWIWGAGLVLVVALVVLGLVSARGRTTASNAPPPSLDARGLVQAALQTWESPAISGTLHLQARATTMESLGQGAMITDVWASGSQSSAPHGTGASW